MPLYRFVCKACQREEMLLLGMNSPVPSCEYCGGTLVKQISNISSYGCPTNSQNCADCSKGNCSSCGQ